jgi:hypothetical protein
LETVGYGEPRRNGDFGHKPIILLLLRVARFLFVTTYQHEKKYPKEP